MGDLWQDEGFGGAGAVADGDDDWDKGDKSIDSTLEDGLDDPDELDDDGWEVEGEE